MLRALYKMASFFAYTNVVVAAAAAAFCEVTFLLLGQRHTTISVFVFFATLLMYAYSQWFESPGRNTATTSALSRWQGEHLFLYYAVGAIGFGGTLFFLFQLPQNIWPWLLVCVAISAIYPLQFVSSGAALRNISGLKLMVIAAVWAVVTTIIPAVASGLPINFLVISLTIQRFFYTSALALVFDIRDLRVDSPNIGTLPYTIGVKKSRITGTFFVFLAEVIAVFLFFMDAFGASALVAQLIVFEVTSFLIYRSTPKKPDFYFSWLVELMPILLLIALRIFIYFWPS